MSKIKSWADFYAEEKAISLKLAVIDKKKESIIFPSGTRANKRYKSLCSAEIKLIRQLTDLIKEALKV